MPETYLLLMESHFEINVALNGSHFFATAPRSLKNYDTDKLKAVLAVMVAKFPKSEGYEVSCSEWVGYGHGVNVTEFLATGKTK